MVSNRRARQLGICIGIISLLCILYYVFYVQDSDDHPVRMKGYAHVTLPLDHIPSAKWECTGSDRHKSCTVENLCIDAQTGGFIVVDDDAAEESFRVNVINADRMADWYFEPAVKRRSSLDSRPTPYMSDTIFVYGLYSPRHYAHMLFNGLIPLYKTMRNNKAKRTSWTYRAHVAFQDDHGAPLLTTRIMTDGKDIVRQGSALSTDQQMLLPHQPICFAKAVVGSGLACSLSGYCHTPILAEEYAGFSTDTLEHLVHQNLWDTSVIASSQDQGLACVRSMKTTHVQPPPMPGSPLPKNRTIAIINRKSRHITNIPEVIAALQKTNATLGIHYIINEIDFDEGCSLASTAYLLKDTDVLLTPHGSQEAAALFMKNNGVVLSIDGRGYQEIWFHFVMTAMGRRFYNFECHEDICTETDRKLFDKMRNTYGFPLVPSEQEIQGCLAWENGESVRDCYRARLKERKMYREEDEARLSEGISSYLKDTPRKVNVARLMPFLERTLREMSEFEHENADYRMICDAKKCCGDACGWALETVVYGSQLEGRMKAWAGKIEESKGNWIE